MIFLMKLQKKRKHPHLEALHAAGWVSLFLLHTTWPFIWIWAYMYNGNVEEENKEMGSKSPELTELDGRIKHLEQVVARWGNHKE